VGRSQAPYEPTRFSGFVSVASKDAQHTSLLFEQPFGHVFVDVTLFMQLHDSLALRFCWEMPFQMVDSKGSALEPGE
jgi:hypothetical protein